MKKTPTNTLPPLADLSAALKRLTDGICELGLAPAIWDRDAQPAGDVRRLCPQCAGACPGLEDSCRELAERVLSAGEAAWGVSTSGCRVLALPIQQRRRLVGAVTACHRPGPAEGTEQAPTDQNGAPENAPQLLKLLDWLLRRELEVHVAGGELANLSANLASTYEELSLLYRISGSMRVSQAPRDFLQNVCNELLEVMDIEAAAGIVHARQGAHDDEVVLAGSAELNADQIRLLCATTLADSLARSTKAFLDNRFGGVSEGMSPGAVRNLVAVPLVREDRRLGVLLGLNKRRGDFDSVDLKLVNSIGNQAGVFLANARLYADVQDLLMGVLHALTATIDAKDPYTCGHSQRVAMLSRMLAEAYGFAPEKVEQVYLSGLLHDIGKIGVPERVLCKEGRLTAEEYDVVKHHPALGAKILQGIRQLDEVVVGILTHHERPDGKGYPRGLSGQEVPIEGRIVGLADVFDAMTSDRTYRKALPLEQVLDEIRRCAGAQFDPLLVERLLAMDLAKLLEQFKSSVTNPLANVTRSDAK